MNTKRSGEVNFIIFKEKTGDSYTAVCLEFDIVETGNDLEFLRKSIEEAAKLHIETVRDFNLDDSLLNRHAPKAYWDMARQVVADYESSLVKEHANQSHSMSLLRDLWTRNTLELLPA